MTWKPLPGRVIVTREQQLTSKVLHVIANDLRAPRSADRGKVLAAGDPPSKSSTTKDGIRYGIYVCEPLKPGDEVFYLGPEDRLAIDWEGQKAYAISYEEVLGVIDG